MREYLYTLLLVRNLWYCEPFQITATELEFWTTDQVESDQLKLQVEEKLYPPSFQVAVGGNITENVLAKFSFKGAMETLNGVVLLETSGITLSPL